MAVTSPTHAEVVTTDLFDRVRQLANYPKLGSVYKQAGLLQVRELLLKNYRIVWYLGRKQIDIMAVLHQRQQ